MNVALISARSRHALEATFFEHVLQHEVLRLRRLTCFVSQYHLAS